MVGKCLSVAVVVVSRFSKVGVGDAAFGLKRSLHLPFWGDLGL